MPEPKMPTPEEIAKIEEERATSDTKLIREGAGLVFSEKAEKQILKPSKEQVKEIHEEMKYEHEDRREEAKERKRETGKEIKRKEVFEKIKSLELKENQIVEFKWHPVLRDRDRLENLFYFKSLSKNNLIVESVNHRIRYDDKLICHK